MLNTLLTPSKHKFFEEDDVNDIDMSAIRNPKLSSTRIERPRRVHAPNPVPPISTNDLYLTMKQPGASANVCPIDAQKGERQHSDIIEKVLAGIPLTDNEIRRVIHRPKRNCTDSK